MEVYAIVIAVVFLCFMMGSYNAKKSYNEKMEAMLEKAFGNRPDRKYRFEDYDRIKYKHILKEKSDMNIDDITWNDLSMDEIFKLINNTYSSVGEEYLYDMLRTLNFNSEELEEFNRLTEYFKENKEQTKKMQKHFAKLGRTKSVSFYEFIHKLCELPKQNNFLNIFCLVSGIAVIATFFINAAVAAILVCVVFTFNIYTYYREKAKVSAYFVCCKYLVAMTDAAINISKEDMDILKEYNVKIKELTKSLWKLRKNMFLISDGNMSDSIFGIVMDYVRMLFHVDLIKFNMIVKDAYEKTEDIEKLFDTIGRIEAAMAVGSFKAMLNNEYGFYALPRIHRNVETKHIGFDNLYHPLIKDAVKNSMKNENAVLLTGSNASGKSTFLKTVAINAILSQTIYVSCAKEMQLKECLVCSSMALKDNLENNESYYIVEIKSLKRILDKSGREKTVLCFVDEVLRGTNTAERIAASSIILEEISKNNAVVFAATHDIELTRLINDRFTNYHFEEEVRDDDVLFNYRLKQGPATTRNAIKLLKVMGYKESIVNNATARAVNFLENGVWS